MKKIWKKIENNKILFCLLLFIVLLLFMFLTTGLNGTIVSGWYGLTNYIYRLTTETSSGRQILGEITWALLLIPLILAFKNRYIFSEKRLGFKETIKIIWPMLLMIFSIMILRLSQGNAFTRFNFKEFVATLILCFFVGVFEEILCRGWLQNELIERFGKTRKDVILSIVFSGLIFGSIHIMNFFVGQELIGTIIQVISADIFGIYIGSIYYKTKNIWVCILLHGLWDFAIFMGSLNVTTACTTLSQPAPIGSGLISNLLFDLPGILIALKILEKVSLEKTINPKSKFTQEEIEKSETFKSRVSIAQIVVVSIFSFMFVFGGLMTAFVEPEDVCMNYEKVTIDNYSFTTLGYVNYDIDLQDYIINVKVSDDKLVLYDMQSTKSVEVSVPKITDFGVIKKDDKYIVMAIGRPEEDYMVYYSDFIDIKKINKEDYLDKYKDSFKILELPEIVALGYYTSSEGEIYPWFRTTYDTFYFKDKDKIKQLVIE